MPRTGCFDDVVADRIESIMAHAGAILDRRQLLHSTVGDTSEPRRFRGVCGQREVRMRPVMAVEETSHQAVDGREHDAPAFLERGAAD